VIGTPWPTPQPPLVRTRKAESGSNKMRGDDKSCAPGPGVSCTALDLNHFHQRSEGTGHSEHWSSCWF
jgi:hypothetical protein